MKLTVKPRLGLGWTHVRGGRVLRVTREHQIAVSSYSSHVEGKIEDMPGPWPAEAGPEPIPHKRRVFDGESATALAGDLAIEVLAARNQRLLGYYYLSGPAINLVRYVTADDGVLVAGWFATGKGIRIALDHAAGMPPMKFVEAMMGVKYSGADVAVTLVKLPDVAESQALIQVMNVAFGYEAKDGIPPTTDVILKACSLDKKRLYAHLQIPRRCQEYGVHPFAHDVLLSSPELVSHDFAAPLDLATSAIKE